MGNNGACSLTWKRVIYCASPARLKAQVANTLVALLPHTVNILQPKDKDMLNKNITGIVNTNTKHNLLAIKNII